MHLEKPFPDYHWRWASANPSEGLNKPNIFLGVLKAVNRNNGARASSKEIHAELKQLDVDLKDSLGNLTLARTPARNIFRNMKQYWLNHDLLEPDRGFLKVTPFGQSVATGGMAKLDFAVQRVFTHVLPNPRIQSKDEVALWEDNDLEIKPLLLIMAVCIQLFQGGDTSEDQWLSFEELRDIVVPGAGAQLSVDEIVDHILQYRVEPEQYSSWPNCVEGDNDPRMLREFPGFLAQFGLLEASGYRWRPNRFLGAELVSLIAGTTTFGHIIPEITSELVDEQRRRIATTRLARPGQQTLRKAKLEANGFCPVSLTHVAKALHLAHIRPVEENGPDTPGNTMLLRSDIHSLFDSGLLGFGLTGELQVAECLESDPGYQWLPEQVTLPSEVSMEELRWRIAYHWPD